jgi:NADPH:quinone reductase
MRAIEIAQFGPIETASLVEKADPAPRRGEVIVAVHAAPVNFVDALVVTGAYQFLPRLPFTPGKGPAGVVCAIAPDVERLHIGDHVLAMAEHGGYAEKVAVAADQCYSLPRGLSFVQAAAMGVAFDTGVRCATGRAFNPAKPCSCSVLPVLSASPRCNWRRRWARGYSPRSRARRNPGW